MTRSVRAEIGITLGQASSLSQVASLIRAASPLETSLLETSPKYEQAFNCTDPPLINWKLTPNPGAKGSVSRAVYKSFRLISPALKDDEGYNRCAEFLQKVEAIPSISVNSNTGFRLHVNAQDLKCDGLVKVCQNFVKYEDAIDSILPPSRRSGNRYFQSNKVALNRIATTNKERNGAIANCSNTEQLMLLLNPNGKGYKLNLQNLSLRQHKMIEFRSHSSTSNKLKIQSWIGLCLSIVETAGSPKNPVAFNTSRTLEEEFDGLLKNILKKGSLRKFYERRNAVFAGSATKRTGVKRALDKNNRDNKAERRSDCQCCFQRFSISTMCACQEKKHWFCKQCVQKYAKIQLFTNLKSRFPCMSTDGCASDLNTIHLKNLLSRKTVAKVHEVEYLESVEGDKKSMCACPKCGSQAILPKKEKILSCPLASCGHKSCLQCSEPAHEPLKCSQVEKQRVTGARSLIEECMTNAYVRRCPSCNCAFVREAGCNKMTCRNCSATSCYICRELITDTSHFNGQLCPLYSSGDMTDRQNVKIAGVAAEKRSKKDVGTSELEGLVQRLL